MTSAEKVPEQPQWPSHYSQIDIAKAEKIIEWLDGRDQVSRQKRTLAELARAAGVNHSTAHQALYGAYPSSPTTHLNALEDAVKSILNRYSNGIKKVPFVETSVYQMVEAVCHRAREHAHEDDVGVLFGRVGVGKTTALKEYRKRYPGAIYLRAFNQMNPSVLLNRLVSGASASVVKQSGSKWSSGTNQDKMDGVIRKLSGTERMIILDETTRATPSCIEILRDIADDAQIGLVLAGRETLEPMLQDEEGRFGEIASRIGYWPPVIIGIKQEDCRMIVDAYWREGIDDGEVHDMFWQCCNGSARALSKLLASVRRYCQRNQIPPTAKIVSNTWRTTMRPKRRGNWQ